jgi:hypothetical protein
VSGARRPLLDGRRPHACEGGRGRAGGRGRRASGRDLWHSNRSGKLLRQWQRQQRARSAGGSRHRTFWSGHWISSVPVWGEDTCATRRATSRRGGRRVAQRVGDGAGGGAQLRRRGCRRCCICDGRPDNIVAAARNRPRRRQSRKSSCSRNRAAVGMRRGLEHGGGQVLLRCSAGAPMGFLPPGSSAGALEWDHTWAGL